MTNKKLLMTAGTIVLSAGFFSTVVTAANFASSNANAVVVTPLAIVQTPGIEMNFGTVAGDAAIATTVVLTTGGTTSSADGASVSGSPAAGSFDVTGAANQGYNITLPATITIDDGTNSMTVDTLTSNPAVGAGLLDGAGTQTITLGATLNIGVGQALGTYVGAYTVTVNYQ